MGTGTFTTLQPREVDLEDLRRPVLEALCLAAIMMAWCWISIIATISEASHALIPLLPPSALLVATLLSLFVGRLSFRARCAVFLVGLGLAVVPWFEWPLPAARLFSAPLVVSAAGLLMGQSMSFVAAGALSVAMLGVFGLHGQLDLSPQGLYPLVLVWITAVITWLSAHNLYAVLAWALHSQARAWETADEARRRREQLRRMVDSLRTTHELLERTTRELELARREAETARRLKGEFAANISHELRTPLNIILGFTEIMTRSPEVYGDLTWPALLRRDVLEIRRNARHLSEFVDDILDLARMDALRMPVRRDWTSLAQVVDEATEIVKRLVENKPVSLRIELKEDLPQLYIDRTRIRQVLINLLTNACRFTEQGHVTVAANLEGEEEIVCVSDTGAGIPTDQLERIFDEFEQAGAWRRPEESGKGLGLAIAKHLVQLHGGRIWATSRLNEGSSFYFSLPLREAAYAPLLRTADRPLLQGLRPKQLVLLSKEEQHVAYLRRHMEGYETLGTPNVEQASELVNALHPEAVIVNLSQDAELDSPFQGLPALPAGVPVIGCHLPSQRLPWPFEREGTLVKPVSSEELMRVVAQMAPEGDILVVDDDRGFVQFVERSLQTVGEGHRLRWAYDGLEALASMREHKPALALLDMILPHMSGLELARAMRADAALADVAVVLVSGASLSENATLIGGRTFQLSKAQGLRGDEVVQLIKSALAIVRPNYVTS